MTNRTSHIRASIALLAFVADLVCAATATAAEQKHIAGVTDTEIKIGQTLPYSGPASSYATIGKVQAAYFKMINSQGGINGRKITFLSLDDAYNPARTVEQTRRLVEHDQVLLLFNSLGTPTNAAVQGYLNDRRVPQLFVAASSAKFADPKKYPWSMGFQQTAYNEAKLYAAYILKHHPHSRLAALYINNDYGKELLQGLRDGLGDRAAQMLVADASYEVDDPTVDAQIVALHDSGADTFLNFALPKGAAQAIRNIYDIGWHPTHFLNYGAGSVSEVLLPPGSNKSKGIISVDNLKDPTDKQWQDDPAMNKWRAWMRSHYPEGNVEDNNNSYAYTLAQLLVHVLKQCGDDLSRENVMRQATNLSNLELPLLLPGIKINTSPTDYSPIEQVQLLRFDGARYATFGNVVGR